MSGLTIILLVIIVSGVLGIKRPIYGGLAGAIIAPLLHWLFGTFQMLVFLVFIPVGFLIGYGSAFVVHLIFSGAKAGRKSSGPSYIGGGAAKGWGEHGGGIVLSDEELEGIRRDKGRRK